MGAARGQRTGGERGSAAGGGGVGGSEIGAGSASQLRLQCTLSLCCGQALSLFLPPRTPTVPIGCRTVEARSWRRRASSITACCVHAGSHDRCASCMSCILPHCVHDRPPTHTRSAGPRRGVPRGLVSLSGLASIVNAMCQYHCSLVEDRPNPNPRTQAGIVVIAKRGEGSSSRVPGSIRPVCQSADHLTLTAEPSPRAHRAAVLRILGPHTLAQSRHALALAVPCLYAPPQCCPQPTPTPIQTLTRHPFLDVTARTDPASHDASIRV